MFELARVSDIVKIAPGNFGKPLLSAVSDALRERFANKVIPKLGLCVALYDVLKIGKSLLYPGNAAQHTEVEFRMVVFRPHVGEVLEGTLVSCSPQGLRISVGFFDEIHVPSRLLQSPSSWSDEERVWVWDVTPDHQLFLDPANPLRLRVEDVIFREPTSVVPQADAPPKTSTSTSRAGTPTGSGPAGDAAPTPQPAMQIIAGIDRAGLGLTSWWPPD